MDSNGDVGIGSITGDPSYRLQVIGTAQFDIGASCKFNFGPYGMSSISFSPTVSNSAVMGSSSYKMYATYSNYVYYNTLSSMSDISTKENIRDISTPLNTILQIRGIQYDLKREYFINSHEDKMDDLVEEGKNKYGVIAQELKEVLPDLVQYDEETELYSVNYTEMIPILVEAIKEQQKQIEELQAAISSGEALKGTAVNTNTESQSSIAGISMLFQNAPNPFTNETTISFSLADEVKSATLFIYDMSGKQLMSYNLHERGDSQIYIVGGELDAGMYMYSLVVDGLLIGTKQMLLTE